MKQELPSKVWMSLDQLQFTSLWSIVALRAEKEMLGEMNARIHRNALLFIQFAGILHRMFALFEVATTSPSRDNDGRIDDQITFSVRWQAKLYRSPTSGRTERQPTLTDFISRLVKTIQLYLGWRQFTRHVSLQRSDSYDLFQVYSCRLACVDLTYYWQVYWRFAHEVQFGKAFMDFLNGMNYFKSNARWGRFCGDHLRFVSIIMVLFQILGLFFQTTLRLKQHPTRQSFQPLLPLHPIYVRLSTQRSTRMIDPWTWAPSLLLVRGMTTAVTPRENVGLATN